MTKQERLEVLEMRAAAIEMRGKCIKAPGVLKKINRKIANLRKELGITE